MILEDRAVLLTASDLTRASACEWQVLTALDARLGRREPVPDEGDAMLERTAMLGDRHEEALLAELRARTDVVEIPKGLDAEGRSLAVALTQQAVDARAGAIFQAAFEGERFFGYADFVELDEEGRYVVSDAKLARRAKVTALLQLAAYARALRTMGVPVADEVRLLLGDGTVSVHELRDIEPVLLERRARLERIVDERLAADAAIPWGTDGILACGQCAACAEQIALHDDVFQVAGIRKQQRDRLRAVGIETMAQLADASEGPKGMAAATFAALQRQARSQMRSRDASAPTVDVVDDAAIRALPSPSPGDLFFDFEGDPLWQHGDHWGIDYLFGVRDAAGEFAGFWAHSLAEEKQALIDFLAYVDERRQRHPDLHIYHYASYERTHLLSLAARHGVGEEQIDDLLRAGVLVDLYPVVKRSLVIGSASYSLKKLEPLYMPGSRMGEVTNAGDSIVWFQQATELREAGDEEAAAALFAQIEEYNAYDVESTHRLRDWLLELVAAPAASPAGDGAVPPKEVSAERAEVVAAREALVERLLAPAGDDPAQRTPDQLALALAAAAVGYHARERKTFWWEHFSRLDDPLDDWRDQRDVITVDEVLEVGPWEQAKQSLVRRVRFRGTVGPGTRLSDETTQQFAVYEPPHVPGDDPNAWRSTHAKTTLTQAEDVFELVESAGRHTTAIPWEATPIALAPAQPPNSGPLEQSIERWAGAVADSLAADGELAAALPDDASLDVLRRRAPARLAAVEGDGTTDAIVCSLAELDASFVAVQGPPGTGKTYTGARVIAALVRRGWRIGVVAQSHATVEHMLDGVVKAGVPAERVLKKLREGDKGEHPWTAAKDASEALGSEPGVMGGTAWAFAGHANKGFPPLDLLVIDEAGQFSLANTIAAGGAARRLLLIGDPQQLPQVSQGTHPAPVDGSALGWLCDGEAVIPERFGYFLGTSWRMHPALCEAVSDLAYDGRLGAHGSERRLVGVDPGLEPVAVRHAGNTTSSAEEADAVVAIVQGLVGREWHDGTAARPLTAGDVIVVAPYNAQVGLLHDRLAAAGFDAASVGTVDRFQGREAAIVIVSMAASSAVDVPRGIEFLLSVNRLNVAISRGQWRAYLVHSPGLRAHLPPTPEGVAQLSAFLRLLG
ncbi:TM0106 family RecB-like putative nuclease [Agrococcus citreus]|uniref:TM0106 family RecB-like putative nuclease n=1 Tax=Agrococcus citreus TaxID=84643 RepID=A0ABN1YUM7_9MICO